MSLLICRTARRVDRLDASSAIQSTSRVHELVTAAFSQVLYVRVEVGNLLACLAQGRPLHTWLSSQG